MSNKRMVRVVRYVSSVNSDYLADPDERAARTAGINARFLKGPARYDMGARAPHIVPGSRPNKYPGDAAGNAAGNKSVFDYDVNQFQAFGADGVKKKTTDDVKFATDQADIHRLAMQIAFANPGMLYAEARKKAELIYAEKQVPQSVEVRQVRQYARYQRALREPDAFHPNAQASAQIRDYALDHGISYQQAKAIFYAQMMD